MKLKSNQQAFTIIELMIATMVFSVILVLVTTGILQITNAYYKGALQSRTQETARSIIDEISRGIQFSGEEVVTTRPYTGDPAYPTAKKRYGICVGGVAYSYIIDKQLAWPPPVPDPANQNPYVLTSYRPPGGCTVYASGPAQVITPASVASTYPGAYKELLGIGMRLTALDIIDNGNQTYTVTVEVASGEFDLFDDKLQNIDGTTLIPDGVNDSCKTGAGKQFCAISRLSTTVQKRVKSS